MLAKNSEKIVKEIEKRWKKKFRMLKNSLEICWKIQKKSKKIGKKPGKNNNNT